MTDSEKWQVVVTNDKSYDGRFFYGVKSTGIFCRPSCASKPPKRENVVFFDCAEDAVKEGFRPCKRCRPDLLVYDPGTELAAEAKAIIDRGFVQRAELQDRLSALGITRRHLTELFERAYGLSPEQYAAQIRFERAKELLDAGSLVTDAAFAVGMESAAAFTTFFKKQAGMSPSDYVAHQIAEHPSRFFETPLGWMRGEEDERGVTSLQFADGKAGSDLTSRPGLYLSDAEAQIAEYFAGRRRSFDLPLSPRGSEFQQQVWGALRDIPYGETRSYQEIAAAVGDPKAARAVGMANNRNPILILIPCHRVVGKSGKLVGYAAGIERKQYLLEMESAR